MTRRRAGWALLAAPALLLAGCGAGSHSSTVQTTVGATPSTGTHSTPTQSAPTESTQAKSAQLKGNPAEVRVIQEWAAALQQGHIQAAAAYFARPSVFANGYTASGLVAAVDVRTEHDAEVVNESLSCGAKLVATQPDGQYIHATFTLTNRKGPGADCGTGTGAPAATDFIIRQGRIVEWIRAPVTTAPQKLPTPVTPTNPQTPGAQI